MKDTSLDKLSRMIVRQRKADEKRHKAIRKKAKRLLGKVAVDWDTEQCSNALLVLLLREKGEWGRKVLANMEKLIKEEES